jgi:hypothetical protein
MKNNSSTAFMQVGPENRLQPKAKPGIGSGRTNNSEYQFLTSSKYF